jgi:hypothetical protein
MTYHALNLGNRRTAAFHKPADSDALVAAPAAGRDVPRPGVASSEGSGGMARGAADSDREVPG